MLMIGPLSRHVVEALLLLGLCEAGCELNRGEMDTATVQSLVQQSPLAKPAQVAPISPSLSCPCNIPEILQSLGLWLEVIVKSSSSFTWEYVGLATYLSMQKVWLQCWQYGCSLGVPLYFSWAIIICLTEEFVSTSCSFMEDYVGSWMFLWGGCKAWDLHWMWNVFTFRSRVSKRSVHYSWPLIKPVPSYITVQTPASSTW